MMPERNWRAVVTWTDAEGKEHKNSLELWPASRAWHLYDALKANNLVPDGPHKVTVEEMK